MNEEDKRFILYQAYVIYTLQRFKYKAISFLAKLESIEANDLIIHQSPCNIDEYKIITEACKVTEFPIGKNMADTLESIKLYLNQHDPN